MKKYFIVLISVAGIFLFSCGNEEKKENAPELVKVKTTFAEKKRTAIPVRSSGILAAKKEMKLSFKTGGIIEDIYVDEGEDVQSGAILARLDPSEIRARVKQAELALNKARRDYKRVENLYQDSVATLENLQNAETALNIAQSNHTIAQFNLEHSEIKAPSRGAILRRLSEEHEIVAAGEPVFLFASAEGKWIIRTGITDKDIIKLNQGDSAYIYFDPYPGESFLANIMEVGSSADPYTGTYEVELSLCATEKKLANGFIARVEIFPSGQIENITVPVDAIVDASNYTGYVFAIEKGKPVKRKLKLGSLIDGDVIVYGGLKVGDEFVVEGCEYIQDESIIEIVND